MSQNTPHGDCWTWDGYVGECKVFHSPFWWQYLNAYSVSFVVVVITLSVAALYLMTMRKR